MSSKSAMIRWGIIGGGNVVKYKSGCGFNIKNQSRVVAVLRRNLPDALYTAYQLGASKSYTDIAAFLADPDIDAVYIATPPGLHYPQALACLAANKPVYLEKPFTTTAADAEDLVAKFKQKSLPLFVAHYRRAMPKFQKARELVQSKIGEPLEFDFRLSRNIEHDLGHPWLFDKKLSGGGKFFDIAPHYIDMFIYLFGGVSSTQASARHIKSPNRAEDIIKMIFSFTSGLIGSASFNLVSNASADILSIYGTNGELHFGVSGDGGVHWKGLDGTEEIFNLPYPRCVQAPMILEVVNCLLGKSCSPCFGHHALETVYIIETSFKHYHANL